MALDGNGIGSGSAALNRISITRITASLTERLFSSTNGCRQDVFLDVSSGSAEVLGALKRPSMIGLSVSGKSRAVRSTSWLAREPAEWAAVKGGEAVPKGREDRRRSAAEPRTVAPLRAGQWQASRLAV